MSDHAIANARAWLETIREMTAQLAAADDKNRDDLREEARARIEEAPLSVQVRGGWYSPGDESRGGPPEEFEILLTTGGPALRIVGDLGDYGEPRPDSPRLEWQDWGTPWTKLWPTEPEDDDALLAFASVFYFGEGA